MPFFVFVYGGDVMADEKMSKAVAMLCEKYEQLGTLPKRSDFTPSEVCFIKQTKKKSGKTQIRRLSLTAKKNKGR